MARAIGETERRREKQQAFNERNGITPQGLNKAVADILDVGGRISNKGRQKSKGRKVAESEASYLVHSPAEAEQKMRELEQQMYQHAQNLEFEEAAAIRDQLQALREAFIKTS